MFDVLTLDKAEESEIIDEPVPKKAKSTATSTISKPPTNDQNNTDFLNFVPIDNNANNFDLAEILKTIETAETQTKNTELAVTERQPNTAKTVNQTFMTIDRVIC